MGRSKFPGKPPKTVTRKRIKVLAWPEANDSLTVAENIYCGLSLFNETFSDNEKEYPPFHGFSSKEAKLSALYIKSQEQDSETNNEYSSSSIRNTKSCNKVEGDLTNGSGNPSLSTENQKSNFNHNEDSIRREKLSAISTPSNSGKDDNHFPLSNNGKRQKFSSFIKNPVLKSVNNILDRHQRSRQLRNSRAQRLLQKAKTSNIIGRVVTQVQSFDKSGSAKKFVLPMRSAHSSRMIKPNKRFIEELEDKSNPDYSENNHTKQTKKSKKTTEDEDKLLDVQMKSTLTQGKFQLGSGKSKSNKVSQSHCFLAEESLQNSSGTNLHVTQTHKPNENLIKGFSNSNHQNFESSRIQTRSGTLSVSGVLNSRVNEHRKESNESEFTNLIQSSGGANLIDGKCSENQSFNYKNDSESSLSENESHRDEHLENEEPESTGTKLNGGKVILRKARLKLDSKTMVSGTEGPFSMMNGQGAATVNCNSGLTGTVKCGVCGAVRFYRFVKQARKFGIYSCESCRKFISKIIKRHGYAKSTNNTLPVLQCQKGDGLCLVTPIVRSQQWNLMRCVYKTRCSACWLKMCLKCYNIPVSIRAGLNAMLPPLLRDPLSISLPLNLEDNDLQRQKLMGCNVNWPSEDDLDRNLFKSAISWNKVNLGQKSNNQGTIGGILTRKMDKFEYPTSISPSKKRKKENRIKVRKKITLVPPILNKSQAPARQRLELKGPRVKHVCRSASVALGQPIATFPSVDGTDRDIKENILNVHKEEGKVGKGEEFKEKEIQKFNQVALNSNISIVSQTHLRKNKNQQINPPSSVSFKRSLPKPVTEAVYTISIDFWEQYDPAEVGSKGFALIGSELFHIPAICFLCGSAGREPLIHCQCCCEPYHPFCLEPSEWNACVQPNWCCPRCTICQTCQLRSGPKLSCIRCRQSFHHSCLSKSGTSTRLYSPDRPYVCQSCIKCKSCGSEGVTVHVGNLPLCSMCFKLRQRGNYCPLCQRCYNENDFDTKMMECNECSCWVHAVCEGLSDERYQILSYLPDTIEFTCRQCFPSLNSVWRNAIEAELRTRFIAVIKSLSKNRKTSAALKWSPRKECLCRPSATVRKLDFDEKLNPSTPPTPPPVPSSNSKTNSVSDVGGENFVSDKSTVSNTNVSLKSDLSRYDFECDEQPIDARRRGLRRLKQKIHSKEFTGKAKIVNETVPRGNPDKEYPEPKDCNCSEQQIIVRPSPTLMAVKRKVNSNEYSSLSQFHCDMEHVIKRTGTPDLLDRYHNILKRIFSWFDPLNPVIENGNSLTLPKEFYEDNELSGEGKVIDKVDVWKENILKSPKSLTVKTGGNIYSNISFEDTRSCYLCKGIGDGQELREGRLLYCGQNEWVHSNCALWSNEVFEEIDGSLQNVHSAISRGRLIRCSECGKKGASVGCCSKNCSNTFHYPCARNIGIIFNDDKTVFCLLHAAESMYKKVQNESEFSLKRPVYVELHRKKKKFIEPNKVKVMIGSLTIDCLGGVSPEFSDEFEKIVPTGYKCSRLYWSTVNPLKVVRYYIRTYVQVYVPEVSTDLENNITIDHSKEKQAEEKMSSEKLEFLLVRQTLDSLIDTVCNKEVDENLAEQNNTDLLPPELKDAIFEDLPHDLLDGISMQDIFPKMNYEDFSVMDMKNDAFPTDLLKEDILPTEVDDMKNQESKISKVEIASESLPQTDSWLESKNTMQDDPINDDIFDAKNQKTSDKELKRNKSEIMSSNSIICTGQKPQHRSCSLTLSCKLDSSYSSSMMRRKLSRSSNSIKPVDTILESHNDGTFIFDDLRIPEITVTVGRQNTSSTISESVRDLKYSVDNSKDEKKAHQPLFWHTRQQPRVVQVDGPADPSSASECSSPEYNIEERFLVNSPSMPQLDGTNDEDGDDNDDDNNNKNNNDNPYQENNDSDFKDILKLRLKKIFEFSENIQRQKELIPKELTFTIPQLDGADDISSDEESLNHQLPQQLDLPPPPSPEGAPSNDNSDKRPVKCKRCQCTYRTRDSYNRHLANCDIMTTSDSDSETMDNKMAMPDSTLSQNIDSKSSQFMAMSPPEGQTLSSDYPDMHIASSPLEAASVPSPNPGIQIEPIAQALITPQIHTHSTVETVHQAVLTSNDMIVRTQYTRTTTTLPNTSVSSAENADHLIKISRSTCNINDSNATSTPLSSSDNSKNLPTPQGSPTIFSTRTQHSATNDDINSSQLMKIPKPRSSRIPKPKNKNIRIQVVRDHGRQNIDNIGYQTVQNNPQLIQVQQSQKQTATPTVILQQMPPQGIMSAAAYVETLQQQSGQNFQYITALGGQHESAFKPQFITTNQLVPGAAYIQTDSDNLLALQNGGISVLPSVQIAQQQPTTVLGTIIQQQPSAIQCGVISSEQLVLSSTPTLEMFADSTGGMFVSSQPMYYGLETIVSNTVMSSSQFVAGAIPQVLASSYQTTTQVFQASKLMDPMVEVQAVSAISNLPTVQAVQGVPGMPGSYVVVNQTPPIADAIQNSQLHVSANPEPTFQSVTTCTIPSAVNSQPVETIRPVQTLGISQVLPELHQALRINTSPKSLQQNVPPIPRVAVRPNPTIQVPIQENNQWEITEPIIDLEQAMNNSVRPYFDSKHVSKNTSMIKSSISSKVPPLSDHCITQKNNVNKFEHDVNNVHNNCNNCITNTITNNSKLINSPVNLNPSAQNKVIIPTTNNTSSRPMNRVLPMQAVTHKQDSLKLVQKPDITMEKPKKPEIKLIETEVDLPIKEKFSIIEPEDKLNVKINNLQIQIDSNNENFKLMEKYEEQMEILKEKESKEFREKENLQVEESERPRKKQEENLLIKLQEESRKNVLESSSDNHQMKTEEELRENVIKNQRVDSESVEKAPSNIPLKIILQKQIQDGSYKITQNLNSTPMKNQTKESPQVSSTGDMVKLEQKQTPKSIQLLPIKTFTLKTNSLSENSENLIKLKTPPIAVKKPRLVSKAHNTGKGKNTLVSPSQKKVNGPSLMYEIRSQDGFTHTASSMTEVWETVFQAVQNARKAHKLPPLPHNPLIENLGLENNATIYLLEQLPGVNRCTKYKPKFHNLLPPKLGEAGDELLIESEYGSARAEPFKGRKVHDIFSWLASRHRQQPKLIPISETESRRAASTNLPMAMRFRILKETSKESVGVYHSHIHGRGLFCLRDIEPGEMVIEYAGEVIRASLTDKREKYYDSKHIGCYMFKIDDHLVVDATMKGNAARFINHSCEPNCYSRVVDILGKKHILIFALRRIVQGEELTYDYKFPFEDIKIPCTCGSRRCRKYLN